MRGLHHNRTNRYPEEMLDKVQTHIQKFPVTESHYCRQNTKRNYLEEVLSTAKMYRLYVEEMRLKLGLTKNDTNDTNDKLETNNIIKEKINEESSKDYNKYEDDNVKEKEGAVVEEINGKEVEKQSLKDVMNPRICRLSKYSQIFNE